MNDLIKRQDAIDAVTDYIHNVDRVIGTGKLSMDDCRDAAQSVLEDLPSAQPEQKWIPCSERLPEVYYDYLGNHSSEEVILLMNDEEYIKISNGHFNPVGVFEVYEKDGPAFVGKPVRDVIAWMPLPEPYKVG